LKTLLTTYLQPMTLEALSIDQEIDKLIDACVTISKLHKSFLEEIGDLIDSSDQPVENIYKLRVRGYSIGIQS